MLSLSTPKVSTILAATDFSKNAGVAIDWACEIAKAHDARLVLFHALMPPVLPTAAPEFVPLPPDVYEAQQEHVKTLIEEQASSLRAAGVKVEPRVQMGHAAPTIVAGAQEEEADLVVLGTRGLTGIKRLILGSVAAKVIRDAPCPVLAVPMEEVEAHRPVRSLLIPTDFSDDAQLAIQAALRMVGPVAAGVKLTLLHVWRIPPITGPWPAHTLELLTKETEANVRRRLDEVAAPLRNAGLEVEITEREGAPADVIDSEAARVNADVIAMGSHGRSGLSRLFLGSVSERTLVAAPCPILTVHHEMQKQGEN